MKLFSSFQLGSLQLPNRVVMAPMTRSRAIGALPNDLMRTYYAQRASAGLVITEGVAPSPNGLGYARIPGLYARTQIERWREITDAVHAEGGRIFAQLMHTGRITHPLNQPDGARVLAPSAVRAAGTMYTDQQGPQPHAEPEEMTEDDLRATRDEFVQAARNAVLAGFDGVELHAANGYLLEQFLHPHTNRRTDAYGGRVEHRARFIAEVAEASASAIGAERVGIRLSPYSTYNDMPLHDEVDALYTTLVASLRGLAYVHLVANAHPGFGPLVRRLRDEYRGPLMLNGGYDLARASADVEAGRAELISFGRPFIANPDLVTRFERGAELASPRPELFYTPGPEGYVDYPAL